MPAVDLPVGSVQYREAGPPEATPTVVFVHGLLAGADLWSAPADALAAAGVRSLAPDWPLGAHPTALGAGADQTPRGVARRVIAFLAALDLRDVTLVGNDTGGAICQLVLDTDAGRVGRVVLTNCDAFQHFPPVLLKPLFAALRSPAAIRAVGFATRSAAVRHSPLGYGMLVSGAPDPALTARWVAPVQRDPAIRDDLARFARAVDPGELAGVGARLGRFAGPALIVWGAADRIFTLADARRLRDAFADARLVELPGVRTFVPLDDPAALAREIVAFHTAPARAA